MGNFISSPSSTLPANTIMTKADVKPVPAGGNVTNFVVAADVNEHTARIDAANSALYDCRTAILASGPGGTPVVQNIAPGMENPTLPTPDITNVGQMWLISHTNSADGLIICTGDGAGGYTWRNIL